MISIIQKKRDKQELTKEEINFIVEGYSSGEIPDYQMSAFLMATYLNGMTAPETCCLTEQMMNSGKVLDLSSISGFKVDKHSTYLLYKLVNWFQEVEQEIKLQFLQQLSRVHVAVKFQWCLVVVLNTQANYLIVRKLFKGGTIDKLESIKGFKVEMTEQEFMDIVNKTGCCIIGATQNIAPADKKIYALRDVTATVASIPLIASSIMSKKVASGTDGLVLDVKVGAGAFMKSVAEARALARAMIDIGKGMNKKMMALLTYMEQPLGQAVGNAIEIYESVNILRGKLPGDIFDLTIEIAGHMVHMAGISENFEKGKEMALESIRNGAALRKFKEMIRAQGGDDSFIGEEQDKFELVQQPKFKFKVVMEKEGMEKGKKYFIKGINALAVGQAACYLGAGRATKESTIDLAVGIYVLAKIGDEVEWGQEVAEVLANDKQKGEEAVRRVLNAIEICQEKVERPKVILETVF